MNRGVKENGQEEGMGGVVVSGYANHSTSGHMPYHGLSGINKHFI